MMALVVEGKLKEARSHSEFFADRQLIRNRFIGSLSWLAELAAHVRTFLQVLCAGWHEARLHHGDHGLRFDGQAGDVILQHDLSCEVLV